ncbi:hypothetical protein FJZ48_01615 [Candidatus Uhrbacteria bacterium]|nr:hypothetical protein [Candidatus Uhrbacteria bacterium]
MNNPSRILTQCPVCQAPYVDERIRLLGARGPTQLFHCSCQQCHHAVIALVLENGGWVSSVGLVTDLEAEDALRFQSVSTLTTDECIQFHQVLEHESKDFCHRLLS